MSDQNCNCDRPTERPPSPEPSFVSLKSDDSRILPPNLRHDPTHADAQ